MSTIEQSAKPESNVITIGKITSVYGIKGWVKIHSFTEPFDNIFEYLPWDVTLGDKVETVKIDKFKLSGDTLVGHIVGCDDRELARRYCGGMIQVKRDQLPELDDGEFYWNDLLGLAVVSIDGDEFGVVSEFLETGSNDVLVVKRNSEDKYGIKERLIPYLPEQVIKNVDLDSGKILVDWEPDF